MKTLHTLILLIIIFFTSCEDVIEVNVDNGIEQITVEGTIDNLYGPRVKITRSVQVTVDEYPPGISDAIVKIREDDSQPVQLDERKDSAGLYVYPDSVSFLGKPNHTYFLEIELGDKIITSSAFLPFGSTVDSIQVHPSSRGDSIFNGVFLYAYEPPETKDFYKLDLYINGKKYIDPSAILVSSDIYFEGNVQGEEIFTDFHDPENEEESVIPDSTLVHIEQRIISQFTYDYFWQLVGQANNGSFIFDVPPANIKSNLECNTGEEILGIFWAAYASRSDTVMAPKPKDP